MSAEGQNVVFRWTPGVRRKIIAAAIAIVLLLPALFVLGFIWGQAESQGARQKNRDLVSEINRQRKLIATTEQQLAESRTLADIDRLAANQVQSELVGLRLEVAELKRDVEFYRGLMAPNERDKGFQLHSASIAPMRADNHFGFNVMLTNIGGRGQVVRGVLTVHVHYLLDDEVVQRPLVEMPDYVGESPIKLRFRFFQQIEGSFSLPADAKPLRLVLKSDVKDSSGQPFHLGKDWSDLLKADAENPI